MSGTSESELNKLIRSIPLQHHVFLGVFDNTFPGFLNPNIKSSAIVNTGSRESGGMHWIAFAYNNQNKTCYMFDPFGWTDNQLWTYYRVKFTALIKRTALMQEDRCVTFIKSTESVQDPSSAACGLFSAFFIFSFDRYPNSPMNNALMDLVQGVKNEDIFKASVKPVFKQNQENVNRWFSTNSLYFRLHKNQLEVNTAIGSVK